MVHYKMEKVYSSSENNNFEISVELPVLGSPELNRVLKKSVSLSVRNAGEKTF